jgi:uncharacterized protein YndB with AHSA1/START domain
VNVCLDTDVSAGDGTVTAVLSAENMKITVETNIVAPVDAVWQAFNNSDDIVRWDACDDWYTAKALNDLRLGGVLSLRVEAKDGGVGFDFAATYTQIEPNRLIEFRMEDDRIVRVEFIETGTGVTVRQTFDAESTRPGEQERSEWQAVLDSFARHVAAIQK